jgi:hypothetical protein
MFSRALKIVGGCALLGLVAGCASDQTADGGIDSHSLTELAASVWVDPDGCKHWVIDDGLEGYMSPVLNADGTPDCT